MSLNQCMREHTHRQYLAWQFWLDEQQRFMLEAGNGVSQPPKPETAQQSKQRWSGLVGLGKAKADGG